MRVIFRKKTSFDARSRPPDSVKFMVWVNGRLATDSEARIPVFDSAYLYGIGIFETLRAVGVVPLFFRRHDERFRRNARAIGLRVPLSSTRLKAEIAKLLKKTGHAESVLRIVLSEGRLVMIAKPFKPYPRRCYLHGARLVIARTVQADAKSVATIKTTSYLTKMLARREAKRRGADEAVLLNSEGCVTEGASSNVFIVKKGRLFTPPLSDGLLPGTRRNVVLALARRLKIPVAEKTLVAHDLMTAEEVFITSTLKDVMPVGFVEGKKIRGGAPRPVTIRIASAYGELIPQARRWM